MTHNEGSHIPSSEAEWLETGKFDVSNITINETLIRCALVRGAHKNRLNIMIGGIPREFERQQNLPLINKLYGLLALALEKLDMSSLLYNQPATGGSGGSWNTETLTSRTSILAGLGTHYQRILSSSEITLIGSSAGAYMAVGAIDLIKEMGGHVSKVILLSPAAYIEKIENVPYGPEFTRILHEPWDVATSPVFLKLEKFIQEGGQALVCFFESDDPPIPIYIQEHYRTVVRQLSSKNIVHSLTIPGVAHNFRKLHKKRRENIIDNESVIVTAKKFAEFLAN